MFLQIIGIQCTIFIFSGNIKIKNDIIKRSERRREKND